jgi:glycosyltransferase involved in cell wall biosynthesis/ubiquinone/menaquinone biosynthesis C-methylase UbiE
MRLLITTQAVDIDDPILGFFHAWIVALSRHVEHIDVICLYEGRHDLPGNVAIRSLGKERGRASAYRYALRFLRAIFRMRRSYDAVLVHMNEEYAVLGAPLWKLWRKKTFLWRNHYDGSWITNIAIALSNTVFCTSRFSYTARSKKTMLMPVGVDTDAFTPGPPPPAHSILSLGRIAPSKKLELLIQALHIIHEHGVEFQADIYGDPLPEHVEYLEKLKANVAHVGLSDFVHFRGSVPNHATPAIYRAHRIFVNTSRSGMYDKTIFEAAASGCAVATSSLDLAALVDPKYIFQEGDAVSLAKTLETLLKEPYAAAPLRPLAEQQSLENLAQALAGVIEDGKEMPRPTLEPDPQAFYNERMPGKLGKDYEYARWQATPLLRAQYHMIHTQLTRELSPAIERAHTIIEIGPGAATWTKLMREKNDTAVYTLVDISREMLARAKGVLGDSEAIEYVESDITSYRTEKTFDVLFSSRAVEYMPQKADVARTFFELLRPGGSGFVITKTPKSLFDRLRGRTIAGLHRGQVSPREFARILEGAGLRVERVRVATATVPGLRSARLNAAAFWMLKRMPLFFPLTLFTESYLICFKKPL